MPMRFVSDINVRYEAYSKGETIVYLQYESCRIRAEPTTKKIWEYIALACGFISERQR